MQNEKNDLRQRIRDLQHFGEQGGVVPVIDLAATSTFLNPEDMIKTFNGELQGCYLYSRHSNPTVQMFAEKFAALEGLPAALGVASGMAAIAATIEQLCPDGGEVISSLTVYGGTYALFKNVFPKQGIQVRFVDTDDLEAVEKLITAKTKVIYLETLSNPLLTVGDLQGLSRIAKKHKLNLVVDNTFAPALISPGRWGADVVIHSCTKFISGASDLLAGVIVGSEEFIQSLIDLNHGIVMLKGGVMDPRVAHELYLRLDHLPIRMQAHSQSAQFLAEALQREKIPVIYPGLKAHPQHLRMTELMNPGFGFGGMLTVDLGDPAKALRLAEELQRQKFGLYAVSLGFSRTLMSCPAVSTSSEISAEDQKKMSLSPGLLRISAGYIGVDSVMVERFLQSYRKIVKSA